MSSIPKSWHKKAKLSSNVLIVRRSSSGEAPSTAQPQHRIVQEPASDSTICKNVSIQLSSQCAIQCFSSSSRSAVLFYLLFGLLPQRNKNHKFFGGLDFQSAVQGHLYMNFQWQYITILTIYCTNWCPLFYKQLPGSLQHRHPMPAITICKKHRISPLVNGQAR